MIREFLHSCNVLIRKKLFPYLAVSIGKKLMKLLLMTCKWQIEGLEEFKRIAKNEKCILMLWHNRLIIAPFILHRYASEFLYSAFISKSRDGELISSIVRSYNMGKTIRVPHDSRHEALREFIRQIKMKKEIVVITPDGPRGPIYKVKEGVALAALQTSAHTIRLDWTANKIWEIDTWDKLRIPRPFSTIKVTFEKSIVLQKSASTSREQARSILQNYMTKATE